MQYDEYRNFRKNINHLYGNCPNFQTTSPFWGKIVILFGDLLQLPAVTNNKETSRQIYESPLWAKFKPYFLQENCRQVDDQQYGQLPNRARLGIFNEEDIKLLDSRICGTGHPLNEDYKTLFQSKHGHLLKT